ncbi:hypothetical protein BJY00DRAFT_316990 [Aspergillus carlsbadensis]|nr:hypothetical protein BJY00DRAFT_316990 [Aspergillus carlsbadensis]
MTTSTQSLSAVGLKVNRHFGSVAQSDQASAIRNEHQRFDLWASSLGLYHLGHSSLDYRLRDSPPLFNYARGLLHDLAVALSNYARSVTDEDDPSPSPAEAFDHDESSSESGEDFSSYLEQPLTVSYTANIVATIDRLYRLAFKVRNPAMRLGLSKSANYAEVDPETGVDLMQSYKSADLCYIKDLFRSYGHTISHDPDTAEHYLVHRLGKANTRRRQQFKYWHKRHAKYAAITVPPVEDNAPVDVKVPSDAFQAVLDVRAGSPKLTAASRPSTATWLDIAKVTLDDTASVRTTTSFVALSDAKGVDDVSVPSPPRLPFGAKEFECPYCCTLCPAVTTTSSKSWETHIFRDLRPYVCTYENCRTPDQQYDSLTDWISHETSNHCPDAQNGHILARKCPFCAHEGSSPAHIARHLCRIALFSLPRPASADDRCDGTGTGSNISRRVNGGGFSSTTSPSEGTFSLPGTPGVPQADDVPPTAVPLDDSMEQRVNPDLQIADQGHIDASPNPRPGSGAQADAIDESERVERLYALGRRAAALYVPSGSMEKMDWAIMSIRAIAGSPSQDKVTRVETLRKLGHLLQKRYGATGNATDLEEVVAYEKLSPTSTASETAAVYWDLHELSMSFQKQFNSTQDLKYLVQAIRVMRVAVYLVEPDSPERSTALQALAQQLLARWHAGGVVDRLDDAIGYQRSAIEHVKGDSRHDRTTRSHLLEQLGQMLYMKWESTKTEDALQLASIAFTEALSHARALGEPDTARTFDVVFSLAKVLLAQGLVTSALKRADEAQHGYKAQYGRDSLQAQEAREFCADLRKKLGLDRITRAVRPQIGEEP